MKNLKPKTRGTMDHIESMLITDGENVESWEINTDRWETHIVGHYPGNPLLDHRYTHVVLKGEDRTRSSLREQIKFGWEIVDYKGVALLDEIPAVDREHNA